MNRKPAHKITEEDIRRYEDDGVVCLRGMFDADWAKRMHDASLRFMAEGKGRERQWKYIVGALEKLGLPKERIEHLRKQDNPAQLAKLVEELMAKQ